MDIMGNASVFIAVDMHLIKIAKRCVLLAALALAGCSDGEPTAAPRGDSATLGKLAASYERVSSQFDSNPHQLPLKERKRFVEFVFRDAGYSYAATLKALARDASDSKPFDQQRRDLAELLILPHQGQSPGDAGIYSQEQLRDIEAIQGRL